MLDHTRNNLVAMGVKQLVIYDVNARRGVPYVLHSIVLPHAVGNAAATMMPDSAKRNVSVPTVVRKVTRYATVTLEV